MTDDPVVGLLFLLVALAGVGVGVYTLVKMNGRLFLLRDVLERLPDAIAGDEEDAP